MTAYTLSINARALAGCPPRGGGAFLFSVGGVCEWCHGTAGFGWARGRNGWWGGLGSSAFVPWPWNIIRAGRDGR